MNKKKSVCFVIVNRANYGRCRSVLLELKKDKAFDVKLVVTSSALLDRFGNVSKIIESDGFQIHGRLFNAIEGSSIVTMPKSTGLAIIELSSIFEQLNPDIVFTIGDRYETLATAVAASYMNITLAHIQGGEITGSIDESVRHCITKLAHIHFPSTKLARQNIIKMGEVPKYVINSGCPSIDNLKKLADRKKLSEINDKGVGEIIDLSKKFILVVFHSVTTSINDTEKQIDTLIDCIEKIHLPIVWLWPNIDSGSDTISKKLRIYKDNKERKCRIRFIKNLEIDTYNLLLSKTSCVLGNSSSFIRETSYLGTPAVLIGNRQNKRERAKNVIDVDFNTKKIVKFVKFQIKKQKYKKSNLYGSGLAAKKIVSALKSILPPIQKTLNY